MVDDETRAVACPDRIALIGGGRWARVLTQVLCDLVPRAVEVSVHSLHNAESMSAWASARGLGQRIRVSAQWPQFLSAGSSAVIVANAARDHERAVEYALSAGVAVLVEKPIALTAAASQRLAKLARDRNAFLAATQVFLFGRYLERFAKLVSAASDVRSLRIRWTDPKVENRYGEQKQYDPGLPIFADWLPHVLSIVEALMPNLPQRCEKLGFLRGGAHLELDLMLGDVPCSVQLMRNGDRRQRSIEVTTAGEPLQLDFSKEPGTIISGSVTMDGDPDWEVKQRPLARMLTAFLNSAGGGERDSRLNIDSGLRASQVIDQASDLYRSALMPWLIARLASCPGEIDDELRYALNEMLQSQGSLPAVTIEQRIERVRQLSGVADTSWLSALSKAQDPSMILRSIAI